MAVSSSIQFNDGLLDAGAIQPCRKGGPLRLVACTLFEGDYHYGVAALVNSLYRGGFRDRVYVGYRGALPLWAGQAAERMPRVQLGDGCELVFVAVETSVHFTNYKPRFMLDILAREPVDGVLYFDPDIVVICRWQFFQDWLRGGVALCQDVNGDMPASHPTRNAWRELLMPFGFRLERDVERYLNGGFVGVHRQDAGFLRTWQAILESLPQLGCDLSMGGVEYGSGPFTIFDQDALNATAMAWTGALSLVGPDGMGFQWGGGGYIMQHAVGPQKPWRKHFWCDALVARRPSRADRLFFENVRGPVRPYGRVELAIKRWDLALGAVIGRYLG